ncbi:GPW/gp25 family protein [Photobacterium damselae]|uniref:GPW/gp25 family protein n=1 Tax=Photobacterium damselae TaxID=38293 RepID=UPI0040686855
MAIFNNGAIFKLFLLFCLNLEVRMYAIKLGGSGRCDSLLDDIHQSMKIIIYTPKGTRIYDPDYGCDALAYIDRPQWEMQKLMIDITNQIAKYEKRVQLQEIYPQQSNIEDGKFSIKATFKLLSDGSTQSLII